MSIVQAALWQSILPAGVAAYETRDFLHDAALFDAERVLVAGAVPKRIAEFAAGRLCARRALADLGCESAPLLRGSDRRPLWPGGTLGSITHTDTYCAAVAARHDAVAGIGIDAETVGRIDDPLLRKICTDDELARLMRLPAPRRLQEATLIFSAKEAFYKCHCSAGGGWLDFHDVALDYNAETFRVRPQRAFEQTWRGEALPVGSYKLDGDLICCAVAFPAQ